MCSARSTSTRTSIPRGFNTLARNVKKNEAIKNRRSLSIRGTRLRDILEGIEQIKHEDGQIWHEKHDAYIAHLGNINLSEADFMTVIQDGRECVDLLEPKYQRLVNAILSMNWLPQNEKVIAEYQTFLHDILTVHNQYIMIAVDRLISYWITANANETEWKNGLPNKELKKKFQDVHHAIRVILDIIPLTLNKIMGAIDRHFPHYSKPSYIYAGYVYNMFMLLDYRPTFTNELLDLLFKRLIDLDTSTSKADIEMYEHPEECDEEFILEINEGKHYEVDEMKYSRAETLDLCMEQLLSYIEKEHRKTSSKGLVGTLLLMKKFDNLILPTYNSHHIQFSIFFYCSLEPKIMREFVKCLWSKVNNLNEAPMIRRSAVCYIASFMVRAKFIPLTDIQNTLKQLCQWAINYTELAHNSNNINVMKAHLLFYSICHAIFYIIAVRIQDLTRGERDLNLLNQLQLESIVKSSLNPLRVCPSATATIFASVTKKFQLVYCQAILERNARQKLAIVYSNETAEPYQTLDTIYPFDPYVLTKSGRRISPIYLQYDGYDSDDTDSPHSTPDRKRLRLESITLNDDLCDFTDKKVKKDISLNLEKHLNFLAE